MQRRNFLKASLFWGTTGTSLLSSIPVHARPAAGSLASHTKYVQKLIERMTLDEKIGQMTQGELNNIKDESDIENYFLGSVLSGGGADPREGNSLVAWTDTVDRLINRSLRTRLAIPILYGVDAVHGNSNVIGATIFPHNIGLGCSGNAELVEQIGRITAREVRATGIRWSFSPCVTVPRDERWGRTYEGYSEDPMLVRELGAAMVNGMQGEDLSDPVSILACAKHFLGDGGTAYGSRAWRGNLGLDQGDTRADLDTLKRIHLPGYISTVAAGVGSIMVSYNSWNGEKVTGIHELLTGLLKEELGFEGFLISDYNAISQVDPDFKTAIRKSVNAGIDMAMEPNRYRLFISHLKELVEEGAVTMARIDDAVTRILRVKRALGLLDQKLPQLADRSLHKNFGSAEHRRVARRAVRESLVLLKNNSELLPINRNIKHIHVAGRGGDDIGMQCGGWTVEWQGGMGNITTGGTTILSAVRQTVSADTKVTWSVDGMGAGGADLGIAVIGETPYAEGVGDRSDLSLADEDVKVVENLKAAGIPVLVILLSGRPLILAEVLDEADALLAAWLPGTEGQGIADVIFGGFAPVGRLSFTWPRSMAQIPINKGDAEYDPLFPFGFGLDYS